LELFEGSNLCRPRSCAFAATIVIPVVLSNDGGNQNQLILNNLSSQVWLGIGTRCRNASGRA